MLKYITKSVITCSTATRKNRCPDKSESEGLFERDWVLGKFCIATINPKSGSGIICLGSTL